MTRRREFSAKTKRAAWERAGHHCEECSVLIKPENGPEYDHRIEDYFNGGNSLDNCRVLCIGCHKTKTRKQSAIIAKSRRLLKKQAGLTRKKKAINNRGFTAWRNFSGKIVTKKG